MFLLRCPHKIKSKSHAWEKYSLGRQSSINDQAGLDCLFLVLGARLLLDMYIHEKIVSVILIQIQDTETCSGDIEEQHKILCLCMKYKS